VALAAALDQFLSDPARRDEMASRGRLRVERDFRIETATRRLETLYSRWLAAAERRLDCAC
jgi:glycosyltransferase involved in cell wall biosynthesis